MAIDVVMPTFNLVGISTNQRPEFIGQRGGLFFQDLRFLRGFGTHVLVLVDVGG